MLGIKGHTPWRCALVGRTWINSGLSKWTAILRWRHMTSVVILALHSGDFTSQSAVLTVVACIQLLIHAWIIPFVSPHTLLGALAQKKLIGATLKIRPAGAISKEQIIASKHGARPKKSNHQESWDHHSSDRIAMKYKEDLAGRCLLPPWIPRAILLDPCFPVSKAIFWSTKFP